MLDVLTQLPSLEQIIRWGGLLMLFAVIFAESGLFFGFFLPGDSLLFTAGLLAASGLFDIRLLLLVLVIAAVLGDQVGFWTGRYLGKHLFTRDTRFVKRRHVQQAHEFYERHGVMAIVLARFVPVVRTFAPIVAGAVAMQYRKFLTYNVIGGTLWVCLMVGAGYYLVQLIPGIKEYLHYVIALIILISLIPVALQYYKSRTKSETKA